MGKNHTFRLPSSLAIAFGIGSVASLALVAWGVFYSVETKSSVFAILAGGVAMICCVVSAIYYWTGRVELTDSSIDVQGLFFSTCVQLGDVRSVRREKMDHYLYQEMLLVEHGSDKPLCIPSVYDRFDELCAEIERRVNGAG